MDPAGDAAAAAAAAGAAPQAATSSSSAAAAQPTDASSIQSLLQSMGADEYEPRVVAQLLNFMYKYVTDTLLDAEAYSEHAGKAAGTVEIDDVMLAIQSRTAYTFVQPPSLDMVADLAKRLNARELPKFPSHKPGVLLPEDKECLTAQNYQYAPQ